MGAIGDSYVTLNQLKAHLGIDLTDTAKDDLLTVALQSASQEIENHCHRQFNKVDSPSARIYRVDFCELIVVDDFYTTAGMTIKIGPIGGGFGPAWATSQYRLEPQNGVVNGIPGWPYWRIALTPWAVPLFSFEELEVTAAWGWGAVPAPVKESCLLLAAMNWKLRDAPLGVAGFKDFGTTKVRDNPIATARLCPYVRQEWAV